MMQALARSIAVIEASTVWREATDALRAFAVPHGYDRFVIWSAASQSESTIGQIYWVEGDWFGDARPEGSGPKNAEAADAEAPDAGAPDAGTVDAETYLRRCPVNQHIFGTERPFFWTKQGDSYRLTPRPHGSGLHGLQVPVFGANGLRGAVSFGGNRIDSSLPVRLALAALAGAAFDASARMIAIPDDTSPTRLSPREREVMRWIAAGKRQADAARLLGLSERTVENHLRRIRHRLGASTTAEAIRLALSAGEIDA